MFSMKKKKELPSPVMYLLELIFEKNFQGNQAQAYSYYKTLNSRIRVLSSNSKEHQMIRQYVNGGQGPTHTFTVKVMHIFTISRPGEYAAYKLKKNLGNTKLLWHGTQLSNLPSILINGLRTKPPSNVQINGKLFGNGIYFADVVTKAALYCKHSRNNPYGVLILAEVALGKHHYYSNTALRRPPTIGKSSTKGLGKYKPDKTQSAWTC